jgi:hypothetical protein
VTHGRRSVPCCQRGGAPAAGRRSRRRPVFRPHRSTHQLKPNETRRPRAPDSVCRARYAQGLTAAGAAPFDSAQGALDAVPRAAGVGMYAAPGCGWAVPGATDWKGDPSSLRGLQPGEPRFLARNHENLEQIPHTRTSRFRCRNRIVPICGAAATALSLYLAESRPELATGIDAALFLSRDGTPSAVQACAPASTTTAVGSDSGSRRTR